MQLLPAAPTAAAAQPAPGIAPRRGYHDRLLTTRLGWPRMDHWCVWIEPSAAGGVFEQRWQGAVEAALGRWSGALPITRVLDRSEAQVVVLRRRPPLRSHSDGVLRASHGRTLLQAAEVRRQGRWRLEPQVEVWLSPAQRALGIQATALHELGHAFGLWGHSDMGSDAMAAAPGAEPVLELSARDRATLQWLYRQPTGFGAWRPPAGGEAPEAPGP